MRQTLSRGMVAAAAATGVLSLCGSPVFADSGAEASTAGSPGVLSGNSVQIPLHVPVNICGNTVDVVAALNPAFGNACGNGRTAPATPATPAAPAPPAVTVPAQSTPVDGSGTAEAPRSPVVSQHTPAASTPVHHQTSQGTPQYQQPHLVTPVVDDGTQAESTPALAETGGEGIIAASAVSVALLAGGLVLYRRGRVASHR
ncbi:chaplin [Streptomyces nodosus]|uniref:chaplin n=1 Tax=Streptomyces nodosus TaxID=40318 RepID=UPI0034541D9B